MNVDEIFTGTEKKNSHLKVVEIEIDGEGDDSTILRLAYGEVREANYNESGLKNLNRVVDIIL